MSITTLVMFTILVATFAGFTLLGRARASAWAAQPARRTAPHRAPSTATPLAATIAAPDTATIEWDERADAAVPPPLDELRAKLRDRYIKARFPGVVNGAADLQHPGQAIRIARQYLDEGKADRAQELLKLAAAQSPGDKSLRLARIEIAFLSRDRDLFTPLARDLLATRPDGDEWADVARLGRALAPDESLFGPSAAPRKDDHYGPWPTPNWIQASWDLTPEALAGDFHRALRGAAERAAHSCNRQAA